MALVAGNESHPHEPIPEGSLRWVVLLFRRLGTDAYDFLALRSSWVLQPRMAFGRGPSRRLAGGVIVVVMAISWWVSGLGSASDPGAPAALATAPCRPHPMEHVHDPTRLVVVSRCSTAKGVVQRVARDPLDGDTVIAVAVDAPYQRFLPKVNAGRLVVKVIPTDAATVTIPLVGEHATFHGAWVLDRNADRRAEIHPAWLIVDDADTTAQPTPAPAPEGSTPPLPDTSAEVQPGGASGGTLALLVDMPRSVPVGGHMTVAISTRSGKGDDAPAAPEVQLFLEIVSDDGDAVRWKALSSNTLGIAATHLVALQPPGDYTLTVFAQKGAQTASANVPFRVRRR